MSKKITLEVGSDEIRFEVSARDVESYQDDVTLTKKVVPSKRLLKGTVTPEDREKLQGYIDQGFALDIAAVLLEEYQGELTVVAKKSSGD